MISSMYQKGLWCVIEKKGSENEGNAGVCAGVWCSREEKQNFGEELVAVPDRAIVV